MMTGKQLNSLMRKNKVTIKQLADRTKITQKRIREARKDGLIDPATVRDWVQAITGSDPGPNPTVEATKLAASKPSARVAVLERMCKAKSCGLMVPAEYLVIEGERIAAVSGSRCRSCGASAVLDKTGLQWLVKHSTAYCPKCNGQDLLDDIRNLADGTMATLTGEGQYDALEEIQAKFVRYAETRVEYVTPDLSWESWQDAWAGFVKEYPQYAKPETVEMYTTAPTDYDGFGTKTVIADAGKDCDKTVRKVEVVKEHETWQRQRYFSGCHSAYDRKCWFGLCDGGIATSTEPEENKGEHAAIFASCGHPLDEGGSRHNPCKACSDAEPVAVEVEVMASVDRVTVAPAVIERDGFRAERFPNKLGWTVTKDDREHDINDDPVVNPAGVMVVVDHSEGVEDANRCFNFQGQDPIMAVEAYIATLPKEESVEEQAAAAEKTEAEKHADAQTLEARHVLLLPANLGSLAKLCSKENPRYATTGLRVRSTKEGYRIDATDGKRLGIVTGPVDDAADYPPVPALATAPNGEAEAFVQAGVFEKVCKTVCKRGKPILGNVATVLGKDVATLATTDLENFNVQSPRNVQGRFPNTDDVFPKEKRKASFFVDATMLADMLKVAKEFSAEGQGKVEVIVYAADKPIEIRSQNEKGQKFRGLIMPLS